MGLVALKIPPLKLTIRALLSKAAENRRALRTLARQLIHLRRVHLPVFLKNGDLRDSLASLFVLPVLALAPLIGGVLPRCPIVVIRGGQVQVVQLDLESLDHRGNGHRRLGLEVGFRTELLGLDGCASVVLGQL